MSFDYFADLLNPLTTPDKVAPLLRESSDRQGRAIYVLNNDKHSNELMRLLENRGALEYNQSQCLACALLFASTIAKNEFKYRNADKLQDKFVAGLRTNWVAQSRVSRDLEYIPKRQNVATRYPSGLPESCFPLSPVALPSRNSVLIEIHFVLTSPWYARSEEQFAPIDNMCCKDYLTGRPMVRPSSWKGNYRTLLEQELLGLKGDAAKNLQSRVDTLFGPDKKMCSEAGNQKQDIRREGRLIFYPTYFNVVPGGEVICPHDREKGIAINPIPYEVVPAKAKGAETEGTLKILYFPFDLVGKANRATTIINDVCFIINKSQELLEQYGFSAKKTIGWGIAKCGEVWITPGQEIEPHIGVRKDWAMENEPADESQTFKFSGIKETVDTICGMEEKI